MFDVKGIKNRIELILNEVEEARTNDKVLWLEYMLYFTELINYLHPDHLKDFKELILGDESPKLETLSRVRRLIQENNRKNSSNNTPVTIKKIMI